MGKHIYIKYKCDKCQKQYKGKFKVDSKGNILCGDCTEPCKEQGKEIQPVTLKEMEEDLVKDLLVKDLKRIYSIKSKDDLKSLELEGNIDPHKLYFQGNSLERVLYAHDKAYKALENIELGKDIEKMNKIADTYLSMREKRLTEDEWNTFQADVKRWVDKQ